MTNETQEKSLNNISNTLYFSSLKNGQFDYSFPLRASLHKFSNNRTEISPFLFEYLCYKIAKKKNEEGLLNNDTAIISEQFLTSNNINLKFGKPNITI